MSHPIPLTPEELDRMGVPDDRQALGDAEDSDENETEQDQAPSLPRP